MQGRYSDRYRNILSVFLILSILICPSLAAAETISNEGVKETGETGGSAAEGRDYHLFDKEYLYGYLTDTAGIITSPLRWGGTDWLYASLTVGGTVGLYFLDGKIKNFVQSHRNSFTDTVANVVTPFGAEYTYIGVGAMYLSSYIFDDKRLRKTALLSLESLLITGAFVQVMKFSFQRHRPNSGDPSYMFDGPGFSSANVSFPSGHASVAFSVLTVVATEYSDIPVIPPIAYGIATLVALSRVDTNDHWASDVFFGSLFAFFVARYITSTHNEKQAQLSIYPIFDDSAQGLIAVYRF